VRDQRRDAARRAGVSRELARVTVAQLGADVAAHDTEGRITRAVLRSSTPSCVGSDCEGLITP